MPGLQAVIGEQQPHCITYTLRYGDAGSHSGIFCSAHKLENMVDVRNKHCAHADCNKCPSFNYPGKTPGMYCGLHKQAGMVDVKHKRDRSQLLAGAAPWVSSLMMNACPAHALRGSVSCDLQCMH